MISTKDLIEKFEKIVVQVQTQYSIGTGFYLIDFNLVITNYHVINGSKDVILQKFDKGRVKADVVYLDPSMDVAFLRPESPIDNNTNVELVSPNHMENGDGVIAIGHPHGLKFTATQGIISKVSRNVSGLRYVQTDAAINPGNSGGPLINDKGQIIGINTFIITESNNLGFALHIDHIFEHLEMLKNVKESIFLCPSCSNDLIIVGKFCPYCGLELPDNFPVNIDDIDHLPPEKIFENILREVNINPVNVRHGNNVWYFDYGSAKVLVSIADDGSINAQSYLAKIPKQNINGLYEYLLRENPLLGTDIRFGTTLNNITLSFSMNAINLNNEHFISTTKNFLNFADSYDDILFDTYKCEKPDYDDLEI